MTCKDSNVYDHHPDLLKFKKLFKTIGLTQARIAKLYKVFSGIDVDSSGFVTFNEMLDFLNVQNNPYTRRVYSIFDGDNSGEVDFAEFVLSTWNYCTLTRSSLILFAFDLYDSDRSGAIEVEEMSHLLQDVYGEDYQKNRLALEVLDKMDRIARMDGPATVHVITVETFSKFCETHPGLLYPSFAFQQELQRKVLGKAFWKGLTKSRITLPNGTQVPIKDILEAHTDEKKYLELKMKSLCDGCDLSSSNKRKASDTAAPLQDVYNTTGTNANRERMLKKLRRSNSKAFQSIANSMRKLSSLFSWKSKSKIDTRPAKKGKRVV